MVNLIIICVVFAVIYFIVVLIGMVESRNEQIEGMQKYEENLVEENFNMDAENLKLTAENEKLKAENKDLKNADARNTGLYYKIIDLSNENSDLKDKIKKLSRK